MRAAALAFCALLAAASAGCELTEITTATTDELVVVEGLVEVAPGDTTAEATPDRTIVLLHRSFAGRADPVSGAEVTLVREDGATGILTEQASVGSCAGVLPETEVGATCYGPLEDQGIQPGERLELEIRLADGGLLRSATTVPGEFDLLQPTATRCRLEPLRRLDIRWTMSEGVWAYLAETVISGLPAALVGTGIPVEEDPLPLTGLAISASDTTIVFPSEFGLFDRADLDRELALLLQTGLPTGTQASVAIAATDRNFTNWVRGGNFNPSGQVRVPSVVGPGTGFFGSVRVHRFTVFSEGTLPLALPPCDVE